MGASSGGMGVGGRGREGYRVVMEVALVCAVMIEREPDVGAIRCHGPWSSSSEFSVP